MLSVPAALPSTTGANAAETVQCVPGAMTPFQVPLAAHVFWEMAKGPVMVTLLTDTPTEPVLATWTFFFFFNDPATTETYTLSLHDALPISTGATPAPARVTG